jgi:hypothetical protein
MLPVFINFTLRNVFSGSVRKKISGLEAKIGLLLVTGCACAWFLKVRYIFCTCKLRAVCFLQFPLLGVSIVCCKIKSLVYLNEVYR